MYPCPGCGGALKFDIASQHMKCDFCGSLYDPRKVTDQKNAEPVRDEADSTESTNAKGSEKNDATVEEVTRFVCPQCGGSIYTMDNTISGFCSFCGTPTVLEARITKEKKPMYILPFKITKEDCKKSYQRRARMAIFAPKALKDASFIDGFRGIYMPYWIYRIKQKNYTAHLSGEKSHRSGDYIITDHYDLTVNIDNDYDGFAHDAASDFADSISERIAPYDVTALETYIPAYLSGFYADSPDVESKLYERDAKDLANTETFNQIKRIPTFHGYGITKPGNMDSHFNTTCASSESCLFPTWFMSYRNKDRIAYATVNGQTGKISADLPIDITRYSIFTGILAVVIFVLLNMMFTFKPAATMALCLVINVITLITYNSESILLKRKENNSDDRGVASKKKPLKTSQRLAMEKTGKGDGIVNLGLVVPIFIYIALYATHPINDAWYYCGIIIGMVMEFIVLTSLIKRHNLLVTRPLPAFGNKGGDDRA